MSRVRYANNHGGFIKVTLRFFLLGQLLGCNETWRENQVDIPNVLPKLAKAHSAEQQLSVLDALSDLQSWEVARLSPSPIQAVRPLLASKEVAVAAKAGELLANWRDKQATPGLIRLLGNPNAYIRLSAALSLTALADPAATEALVHATRDSEA